MRALLLLGLLGLLAAPASAQGGRHLPEDDTVIRVVRRVVYSFAPDRVLVHRGALGLDRSQLDSLRSWGEAGRREFSLHREQLRKAEAELEQAMRAERVSEAEVMAAMERVLQHEANIKRLQLRLRIHTRNLLSSDQQRRFLALEGEDS